MKMGKVTPFRGLSLSISLSLSLSLSLSFSLSLSLTHTRCLLSSSSVHRLSLLRYYLDQVGIAISPMCEDALFTVYEANPFIEFFQQVNHFNREIKSAKVGETRTRAHTHVHANTQTRTHAQGAIILPLCIGCIYFSPNHFLFISSGYPHCITL